MAKGGAKKPREKREQAGLVALVQTQDTMLGLRNRNCADARRRLHALASIIEGAMYEDEGAIMWCDELRSIAESLDWGIAVVRTDGDT